MLEERVKMSTVNCYLSLGSNLGDRHSLLLLAIDLLARRVGRLVRASSIIETEPWGYDSPHSYLNAVVLLQTILTPQQLLSTTQAIERALGRTHKSTAYATQASSTPRYADRTIDIDLIRAFDEHGQEVMCQIEDPDTPASKPLLVLPHPLWQQRDFVMVPLAEIMKI